MVHQNVRTPGPKRNETVFLPALIWVTDGQFTGAGVGTFVHICTLNQNLSAMPDTPPCELRLK